MKNELNAAEWLVLAEFIEYGEDVAWIEWQIDGRLDKSIALLESAKEKIKQTAREIERNVG